jgi:transcriptional regulator with XRE-family HTH domain
MKEKNNAFEQALEWLFQHKKAIDQKDVAKKTGISVTTISRIKNHGVGRPDDKTVRKFNEAFGNIFNPDFLRGQSDVMLASDLQTDDNPVAINLHQSTPQTTHVDQGSLMNAIIAAQQGEIESLKRELKTKEALVAEKDARIADLRQQVADLRNQLAIEQNKGAYGNYGFVTGVADDGERPSARK